jgi:hypothetical protein
MVKLPCVLQVQIMTDDERARDHTTVKNPDLFLSHTGNSANASQPKVAIRALMPVISDRAEMPVCRIHLSFLFNAGP